MHLFIQSTLTRPGHRALIHTINVNIPTSSCTYPYNQRTQDRVIVRLSIQSTVTRPRHRARIHTINVDKTRPSRTYWGRGRGCSCRCCWRTRSTGFHRERGQGCRSYESGPSSQRHTSRCRSPRRPRSPSCRALKHREQFPHFTETQRAVSPLH